MIKLFSPYASALKKRWLNTTLQCRLVALLVFIAVLIPTIGMVVDYRRAYGENVIATVASLEEQARSLLVAYDRIIGDENYRDYVIEYCHQMNEFISPGHLIVVLDAKGDVLVQVHHQADTIDADIFMSDSETNILHSDGHNLAYTKVTHETSEIAIIVAQTLNYMEMRLRNQLINRGITIVVSVLSLISIVYLAMRLWVIRPVSGLVVAAREWATRNFKTRSVSAGPEDFRVLSDEFNAMADELEKHDREHKHEMEQARKIQNNLLPKIALDIAGLKIATEYLPAKEVAGDLYDIVPLSETRTAFVVLDVCGHGISAALLTGVAKMSIHRRLSEFPDLSAAMASVNRDLLSTVPDGMFVTACIGIWDFEDRTWTYCAAGHTGGILMLPDTIISLDSTAPLLGVFEEQQWAVMQLQLEPSARLFLFSDGIEEAPQYYGNGTFNLGSLLEATKKQELKTQVESIILAVQNCHKGQQKDDATIIAIEVC